MTALFDMPGQPEPGWAEISADEADRYALTRTWAAGPRLGWLALNPSTANATVNDQTVLKIMHISEREGYGGAWVGNAYALRATTPLPLRRRDPDPVGPENNWWLRRMLGQVPAVVLAWGDNGARPWARRRIAAVLALVEASGTPALCLGQTAGGQPRHPCRLANATPLEPWS